METHVKAREIFNISKDLVYMPHISLLYGNYEMNLREKICNEIKISKQSFLAEKIIITQSASDPKAWINIAEISI